MAFGEFQIEEGTTIAWRDTGGDLAMTLASLASGAGRQGALWDIHNAAGTPNGLGTTRTNRFRWRFFCQFNTAPVVGQLVGIYAKTGNTTDGAYDNDDGTGNIAVSAEDKLRNLTLLNVLVVDEASAGVEMSVGGIVELDDEDFMPVVWNFTDDALHATAANNGFDLTPLPLGTE